jgi:K+-sensing histidine kinase KdpD
VHENYKDIEKFIKLKITIEDNGAGIKKENIDKLFTDFTKLNEHKQMNLKGTGLGLSICK